MLWATKASGLFYFLPLSSDEAFFLLPALAEIGVRDITGSEQWGAVQPSARNPTPRAGPLPGGENTAGERCLWGGSQTLGLVSATLSWTPAP